MCMGMNEREVAAQLEKHGLDAAKAMQACQAGLRCGCCREYIERMALEMSKAGKGAPEGGRPGKASGQQDGFVV